MKSIKLIIVFLFALTVFGCKSVKSTVKSDIKVQEVEHKDVSLSVSGSEVKDSVAVVVDKGVSAVEMTEEIITTLLSAPDSSGKQYPTQINVIRRNIKSGEHKNLSVNSQVRLKQKNLTTLKDKSDSKSVQVVKTTETKQTESVIPGWIWLGVLVLFSVAALCVYFKLRKGL